METAEQAARRIVDAYVSTWNAHDMEKWAALFAEDAEYITPLGGLQVGRNEILQSARDTHAGWFARSAITDNFMTMRRVGEDAALVLWRWTIVGMINSRGVSVAARTGRTTLVLARTGEDWQVTLAHDVDISTAPWERVPARASARIARRDGSCRRRDGSASRAPPPSLIETASRGKAHLSNVKHEENYMPPRVVNWMIFSLALVLALLMLAPIAAGGH